MLSKIGLEEHTFFEHFLKVGHPFEVVSARMRVRSACQRNFCA